MTHARKPSHDASDNRASVEDLPVLDDVLRDLSTLLQLPWDCRRRRCRATKRCQGGEGPPCFHRYRAFIAHSIEQSGLRGLRRFWQRQRALAAADAGGAGGATADSKRPPPQRSGGAGRRLRRRRRRACDTQNSQAPAPALSRGRERVITGVRAG